MLNDHCRHVTAGNGVLGCVLTNGSTTDDDDVVLPISSAPFIGVSTSFTGVSTSSGYAPPRRPVSVGRAAMNVLLGGDGRAPMEWDSPVLGRHLLPAGCQQPDRAPKRCRVR